jgi:DNA-binding PucR family transcriptional regulator
VPPEEILVAIGRPGHGLDGFRRSHAEALEAARVAALAGGAAAAVTRYERVELVSLLASDFPRARAFVAARLGPLAAATEPAARLRETVLAFLAANGSGTRVLVGTPQAADRVRSRAPIPGRRMLIACRPTLSNQERTWA